MASAAVKRARSLAATGEYARSALAYSAALAIVDRALRSDRAAPTSESLLTTVKRELTEERDAVARLASSAAALFGAPPPEAFAAEQRPSSSSRVASRRPRSRQAPGAASSAAAPAGRAGRRRRAPDRKPGLPKRKKAEPKKKRGGKFSESGECGDSALASQLERDIVPAGHSQAAHSTQPCVPPPLTHRY